MSLPSGLAFVGNGVRLVAGAAASFVQGIGITAAGALTSNVGVPTVFPSGIPCGSDGGVCTVVFGSVALPLSTQNGMAFDATGRLVTIDTGVAVAPLSVANGFNFDANSCLITSA